MANRPCRIVLAALIAALPAIAIPEPPPAVTPEQVVQAQLDAYNARNIEAFLATYAVDAQVFEHPAKPLANGYAEMRGRYAARFKEPNLHAVIVKRIVMGNVVIDHEKVTRTFPEGPGVLDAVVIYGDSEWQDRQGMADLRAEDPGYEAALTTAADRLASAKVKIALTRRFSNS